jgi:lipid II:glycine glycyltransferase (peptidoglycan interpeptide bridge formation enzyme)
VYFVLEEADHRFKAAMPFFSIKSNSTGSRLASLPCAQTCNPLVSSQGEYDLLIEFVTDYIKSNSIRYAELKTNEAFRHDTSKFGKVLNGYSCYTLELDRNIETIENNLHKSCIRRAIKKANKTGLELVVGDGISDVRIFYELYLKMRKELGLLPQPYKFFSTMWEILSRNNSIEILHAKYGAQIVSSIILLKYKTRVTYEYGASRSDMMHLNASPFLLWEAIKRSKSEGYKVFDFGRTSDGNTGLSEFKMRWNTKREVLHYYFIPDVGSFSSVRQKSLAKRMMYYTIRYSPDSLCELMGRVLYKDVV